MFNMFKEREGTLEDHQGTENIKCTQTGLKNQTELLEIKKNILIIEINTSMTGKADQSHLKRDVMNWK